MRLIVLAAICDALAALVACNGSSTGVGLSLRQEWRAYKQEHGKVYATPEEDARRFDLFKQSEVKIETPRGKDSHQRGLNHLSDWTNDELKQLSCLRLPETLPTPADNTKEAEEFLQAILNATTPVPNQLDWRDVPNRVTGVKYQGICGSCWIFSTTGLLEGQEVVRSNGTFRGRLVPLSEQELVDCYNLQVSGCSGGMTDDALKRIAQLGGLESEQDYPYVSQDGHAEPCKFSKSKAVFVNKGVAYLPKNDEDKMKIVLARYGPISVGVNALQWNNYKSGVLDNPASGISHFVLLVGYGTDPEQGDYWIVKNSWGVGWGERGFIRLRRGDNTSAISEFPLVATF